MISKSLVVSLSESSSFVQAEKVLRIRYGIKVSGFFISDLITFDIGLK